MSCVLEILSIQELNIRKENLLKQLKLVEDQISKKKNEEELINEEYEIEDNNKYTDKIITKKIILNNNISNKPIKNIIKIIKNKVEENLNNLKETKNIKIKIIPKNNVK
jgi:hypothetical protein